MSDGATEGKRRSIAGLVFHWERDGVGPVFKLAGFVLLSTLAHGAFFYLFRVVYPASDRVLPTPVEVLLLSEDSPGVQTLLRALDDRDAAFRSSERESVSGALDLGTYASVIGAARAGAGGADIEPGHHPTYFQYEPKFLAWPGAADVPPLPALSESGAISMPPPSREPDWGGERRPGVLGRGERIAVIPGGDLFERKVRSIPELLPTGWTASGTGRVVFMVGVEKSGRVLYRLPTDRGRLPEVEGVSEFIGRLVFEPGGASDAPVEWGMVEVVW